MIVPDDRERGQAGRDDRTDDEAAGAHLERSGQLLDRKDDAGQRRIERSGDTGRRSRQQTAVGQWRFLSPAIAAHEALTDLAGTGYWRHRAFREQVNAFKKSVADFYTPKIHKRETITLADYERMPRFVYQEESSNAWMGRAGAGLAGMLAFAGLLGAWAAARLRPAKLGAQAG